MAKFELKLPKMGESVAEATLTSWLKEVGDKVELDEPVVEIATDKVDSEIPSEVEGTLIKKLFDVDDVIKVGQVMAIIETDVADETDDIIEDDDVIRASDIARVETNNGPDEVTTIEKSTQIIEEMVVEMVDEVAPTQTSNKFYSPLVKNIAKKEGISLNNSINLKEQVKKVALLKQIF